MVNVNVPNGLTCHYCGHVFKHEKAFMKHQCASMIRSNQSKSLDGTRAYQLYSKWLKMVNRGTCTQATFASSKYFSAFFKFISWKRKVKIPDIDLYLRLMIRWKLDPNSWMLDPVYSKYIEYIDRTITVEDHIRITYGTVKDMAKAAEVSTQEVFGVVEPYMIIEYIRARKLSPWMLIKMKTFKQFYSTLTVGDKHTLNEVMRPKFWSDYVREKPEQTELIESFVQRVDL